MLSLSSRLLKNAVGNRASASGVSVAKAYFSAKSGTCKWFNTQKGYGFIIPDDGTDEIFVHQTVVHANGFRSLANGEPVEYEVMTDADGRVKASRVTGPGGNYVQGAPRPLPPQGGYGGYGGGGYGGGGYGGPGGYGGGGYGGPGGGYGGPGGGYGGGGGYGNRGGGYGGGGPGGGYGGGPGFGASSGGFGDGGFGGGGGGGSFGGGGGFGGPPESDSGFGGSTEGFGSSDADTPGTGTGTSSGSTTSS